MHDIYFNQIAAMNHAHVCWNVINFFVGSCLNSDISIFYDLLPDLLRMAIPHLYDK